MIQQNQKKNVEIESPTIRYKRKGITLCFDFSSLCVVSTVTTNDGFLVQIQPQTNGGFEVLTTTKKKKKASHQSNRKMSFVTNELNIIKNCGGIYVVYKNENLKLVRNCYSSERAIKNEQSFFSRSIEFLKKNYNPFF